MLFNAFNITLHTWKNHSMSTILKIFTLLGKKDFFISNTKIAIRILEGKNIDIGEKNVNI